MSERASSLLLRRAKVEKSNLKTRCEYLIRYKPSIASFILMSWGSLCAVLSYTHLRTLPIERQTFFYYWSFAIFKSQHIPSSFLASTSQLPSRRSEERKIYLILFAFPLQATDQTWDETDWISGRLDFVVSFDFDDDTTHIIFTYYSRIIWMVSNDHRGWEYNRCEMWRQKWPTRISLLMMIKRTRNQEITEQIK